MEFEKMTKKEKDKLMEMFGPYECKRERVPVCSMTGRNGHLTS